MALVPPKPKEFDITVSRRASRVCVTRGRSPTAGSGVVTFADPGGSVCRHEVSDTQGRDQRHQQDAGKQFLAPRRGGSVADSDNLTAVQERHRFLFAG